MRLEPGAIPQGHPVSRASDAFWYPSPNFGDRRENQTPSLIVIHYTAMKTADEALHRLCDPAHEVSAHYLISPQGALWQLVDEQQRAWHAGAGSWGGRADINSRSIGIELANNGLSPFAAPLLDRLESLMAGIMSRWPVAASGVIGHSDMAPGRKADPGTRFDWRRLARQGLAVWPAGGGDAPLPDPEAFRATAVRFGYPDLDVETLLSAFRSRFRPGATGPLASEDMRAVGQLARLHPVDRSALLS